MCIRDRCREYHIGHQLVRARQTETKARSQFVLLNADDPSHGKTSAPNKCCDEAFDQTLSVHPVLYCTLCLRGLKVKNVYLNPVLE